MNKLFVLTGLLLGLVTGAEAQYNQFAVEWDYPSVGSLINNMGTLIANGSSSVTNISDQFKFTATDSAITCTTIGSSNPNGAAFNGYVFTLEVPADDTITSIDLAQNNVPGFTSAYFSYSGDQIFFNTDKNDVGNPTTAGYSFTLDYTYAPEPSSLALLVVGGVVGLLLVRRRFRQAATTPAR
jgi:hypothetical protein